jgi:hypothetical protein
MFLIRNEQGRFLERPNHPLLRVYVRELERAWRFFNRFEAERERRKGDVVVREEDLTA